ncbi:cuticle protein 38-like [Aethina tumida]|uniref:cuticle protein 38-like n=1 Tax=Aethina tumida TaxID=116153 RepID=UPI002147480C|nr:cuticle protein 38-like [Aethina tumida]
MFKLIFVLSALACAAYAEPKPGVLAAAPLAVAPAVAPGVVTAQSSQVVARNFNALVAPAPIVAAPAPVIAARAPLVAAPAPLLAARAPLVSAPAPLLAAKAPLLSAPYAAYRFSAPLVTAGLPAVATYKAAPLLG